MASEEALDGEADPMAQDGDAIDGAVDGLRGMLKKDAGEELATNESVDSMSGASALGLDTGADLDDLGGAHEGDDPLNMDGFSGLDGPDFRAAPADEGSDGMFGATADASAGPKLGASGKSGRMDLVMSIPVDVQVILGTSRMAVSSLMKLSEGATIALDRKIGEPVEIMVSGKLIGRGEITVLESDETKFAVRIIEVIGEQQKKAG
ncbi:flagellar motor switch protein FliN [Hoeflea sp. IMCC20628]|uniref:flagellar motor switch protein FliN n=1 Tax=Hoeflea sp. IMCC20628 TaxID=1620421 RepID=UPI00063AB888|nr:flagellar motor switch protein FliN [Hoeflea sp. IMCC20628]AKI02167.1 flagellar motor switch protein FliN [Hoeflea sp. IMCC20628]